MEATKATSSRSKGKRRSGGRLSVSFSSAQPLTHRYYTRPVKASLFTGSLASLAVVSLYTFSCMVVLCAFFAVGAPTTEALLLRSEPIGAGGAAGAAGVPQLVLGNTELHRPRAGALSQALRGVEGVKKLEDLAETMDIDLPILGKEKRSEQEDSGESTIGEGTWLLGKTTKSLRGVADSVRAATEGGDLLDIEAESFLGLRLNRDDVILPGVAEAVGEDMADDIEMEAREMRKSIQMLLRGGAKGETGEVEEAVGSDTPSSASMALTGLRKHLRGERGGAESDGKAQKPTVRVRGDVLGVEAVEKFLGERGEVIEQKLVGVADVIQGGSSKVASGGHGSVGNMLRGSGAQFTVVEEFRENGRIGGNALRGIKLRTDERTPAATDVRQMDGSNLRGGEAVVEAVVIEELKTQVGDNLAANVMAGVSEVAASGSKLRSSAWQEEDVDVIDGVVEVMNEEVRKIGAGRMKGAANEKESILTAGNAKRVAGFGVRGGGRPASDETSVEAKTGRLRRSAEQRMRGKEQQIEQGLKAAVEARKSKRENRLRTVS
eukprot:GHVS01045177.1.p1 GENE.GHVS01045177.1~~GHVS01045177.1.p1  ORF type:complete len:549 (-),score=99.39 GHVS01045177.1:351-1997(-)